MAREIILLGLGAFGEKVLNQFQEVLSDRKEQLPLDVVQGVVFHPLVVPVDRPFVFGDLAVSILDQVEGTDARVQNQRFSYILFGDLGESGTALYGPDFAYLPWVLDQRGTPLCESVTGFFTFSDLLGGAKEVRSDTDMGLVGSFFGKLTEWTQKAEYKPPYTDQYGNAVDPIQMMHGPFDRNYIFVTPGNQAAVDQQTVMVFAERLFYEAYFLKEKQEENYRAVQGLRTSKTQNLFSSFAMVEVTRLPDLLQTYLSCGLHIRILDCLLADSVVGTDLEYYEEKFLETMELPSTSSEFPLDRAAELFFDLNKEGFRKVLQFRVGSGDSAFRDYLKECRERLDSRLDDLRPRYDAFVKSELDFLVKETLDTGLHNLFKVRRLIGNINAYSQFINKVAERVEGWIERLESHEEEDVFAGLEKEFAEVEKKIQAVLKNKLLGFVLFQPIREVAIQRHLLSIPLEKYLYSAFKQRLARSLLVFLKDKSPQSQNPITECSRIHGCLETLRETLVQRRTQLQEKREYLQSINESFYVVTPLAKDEYAGILYRIDDMNFGEAKKQALLDTARDAFHSWVVDPRTGQDKEISEIVAHPTALLKHLDGYVESARKSYEEVGSTTASEAIPLAKKSCQETQSRLKSLASGSFMVSGSGGALGEKTIMVSPDPDTLDVLDQLLVDSGTVSPQDIVGVPGQKGGTKGFTMGASVLFQDYLFMEYSSLKKFSELQKFLKAVLPVPQYPKAGAQVVPQEMTAVGKHVRSILLDRCTEIVRKTIFKGTFRQERDVLSEQDIDQLALALDLPTALGLLDDMALKNYARQRNVAISPDREELTENLIYSITKKGE